VSEHTAEYVPTTATAATTTAATLSTLRISIPSVTAAPLLAPDLASVSTPNNGGFDCMICMAKYAVYVLNPCGHSLCWECLNNVRFNKCPACRTLVVDATRFHALSSLKNVEAGPTTWNAPPLRPRTPDDDGDSTEDDGMHTVASYEVESILDAKRAGRGHSLRISYLGYVDTAWVSRAEVQRSAPHSYESYIAEHPLPQ
jgi:hypothetical protein